MVPAVGPWHPWGRMNATDMVRLHDIRVSDWENGMEEDFLISGSRID